MPRAQKSARKSTAKPAARRPPRATAAKSPLGALPEWILADLYAGLDDVAIARDPDRANADCAAFEAAYKGKLAAMAASSGGGAALAEAVRRYEALDDLMGR